MLVKPRTRVACSEEEGTPPQRGLKKRTHTRQAKPRTVWWGGRDTSTWGGDNPRKKPKKMDQAKNLCGGEEGTPHRRQSKKEPLPTLLLVHGGCTLTSIFYSPCYHQSRYKQENIKHVNYKL